VLEYVSRMCCHWDVITSDATEGARAEPPLVACTENMLQGSNDKEDKSDHRTRIQTSES
jgi:hypothetical protein